MGFHVSTLHNLPVGCIEYFVHVLDISGGAHARWIDENLHTLAASFGRNAGLVTGPRDLSEELYHFLSRNLQSDLGAVERLLHSVTCLIISEGHLVHTDKAVYLIPVAICDENEESHALIFALLGKIAEALRGNGLHQLVTSLGAHELKLASAREGFFVCTLRQLNSILELKPNVAGLGVNLNAAIESLLPPKARSI